MAYHGPKESPDMTPRWPQHRPRMTQVDHNMNAEYSKHRKGLVEWCNLLHMLGIYELTLTLRWLRMRSSK
jgi:hypothetical protein